MDDQPKSLGSSSPGIVERAFELARSGAYLTVSDIAQHLKQERHASVDAHLAGPSIRRDLRRLCIEARKNAASE